MTKPSVVKKDNTVACQKVKNTGSRGCKQPLTLRNAAVHIPTALIENNLRIGFCGFKYADTGRYSCTKQYIAIVTDTETTAVIYNCIYALIK